MNYNSVRTQFLQYFESKSHKVVPAIPVVLKDDLTLLFVNSGMIAFKSYFLGQQTAPYPRIANTQKCIRVSGKHNDLEEVGWDHYHHTYFEMLGNWSFGDYFKEEAIQFAWELLTEVYKLDKSRLYVTVFEGDEKENLAFDTETWDIWKKFIPEAQILKGNKKDNFWEMGEIGPCGPCSEIHYDGRSQAEIINQDGKSLVNADHPDVIEIWNIVMMQYNRKKDGSLTLLPNKHIDTGMGFERLLRILEGKSSNYDTSLFVPIIEAIENICQIKYRGTQEMSDIAFRVIADHIRTIVMTITDGQIPDNNAAGYVIKRIIRRAIRYGYSYLELKQPFLYRLVAVIVSIYKPVFPEVALQQAFVEKVLKEEEESFLRTLSQGITLLQDLMDKSTTKLLNGDACFTLFDTYGFPLDLIELMAKEKGFSVDLPAYQAALNEQKQRSKNAQKMSFGDWITVKDISESSFEGYTETQTQSNLLKYRQVQVKDETLYHLVIDKTPFYAESGGQIGDTGWLELNNGQKIDIIDTIKENQTNIHVSHSLWDDLNAPITAKINTEKRRAIAQHHSATHLLHAALRSVLGSHVEQRGSWVGYHELRFDFSHFQKLSPEEILKVEKIVNDKIAAQIPIEILSDIPLDEAKKRGVMALFGEKYGEKVRVVIMDESYSQELCGGTHVANTADIEFFKIKSETSIASGIRRIVALTSARVIEYFQFFEQEYNKVNELLKKPQNLIQSIETLQAQKSAAQKSLEYIQGKYAVLLAKDLLHQTKITGKFQTIIAEIEESGINLAKHITLYLRHQSPESIALILTKNEQNQDVWLVSCSNDLVDSNRFKANDFVKHLQNLGYGNGGGQATNSILTVKKTLTKSEIESELLKFSE
ncbi:MAG: alanine--tRNA ligase [Chitinophagales bacterium]|nr:alanine--tRNA ligase [Chitinophagales bacterium]